MKRLLLSSFFITFCLIANAQDVTIDGYNYTEAEMLEFDGITGSPSTSSTGKAKVYFDTSTGKLKCSQDGGAYADCVGGGSGSGTVNSGTADRVAIYDTAGTAVSSSSVITDNGTNIGIGTVGPRQKLEINGSILATNFSGSSSGTNTGDQTTVSGNAGTATALAANGANCSGNNFALGVDASGVGECSQPSFSNLSGSATDAQVPNNITVDLATTVTTNANLTGEVTSVGNATTIADAVTVNNWVLGTSTATSINKVALTAPATSATLTIADGKTLTVTNTANISTLSDGKYCKYTASGTLIDCNSTCADITGSADLCDGSDDGAGGAGSQWKTTAVGIGTTGLVGIGTYGPSGMLEVVKVGSNSLFQISSTATADGDYLLVASGGAVGIGTTLASASAGTGFAVMNGNVGIGTWSPTGALEVKTPTAGTITMAVSGGNVGIGTYNPVNKLGVGGSLAIGLAYSPVTAPTNGALIQGNVGIGTLSPQNNLQVNGTFQIDNANSMGWSVKTGTNTACNTTCVSGCVFGLASGGASDGTPVACTDATADFCLCSGPG